MMKKGPSCQRSEAKGGKAGSVCKWRTGPMAGERGMFFATDNWRSLRIHSGPGLGPGWGPLLSPLPPSPPGLDYRRGACSGAFMSLRFLPH